MSERIEELRAAYAAANATYVYALDAADDAWREAKAALDAANAAYADAYRAAAAVLAEHGEIRRVTAAEVFAAKAALEAAEREVRGE